MGCEIIREGLEQLKLSIALSVERGIPGCFMGYGLWSWPSVHETEVFQETWRTPHGTAWSSQPCKLEYVGLTDRATTAPLQAPVYAHHYGDASR